jgi:flavodoxin/Pyruvate/2-oxoacid:ferredoxin oxidoreductase delta subunit
LLVLNNLFKGENPKMPKCIIFYFSGTGNTHYVAEGLKRNLDNLGLETTLSQIDALKEMPDISSFDYIGLGFPTYAFSLPVLVDKFIRNLHSEKKAGKEQKAFAFTTYAGMFCYALEDAAAILRSKGYHVVRSAGFKLVNNITYWSFDKKFPPAEIEEIFKKADPLIEKAAKEIVENNPKIDSQGWIFGNLISWSIGWAYRTHGAKSSARRYHANENCTSCGLCARTCPSANIEIVEGRPHFFERCEGCCRCYNICPVKAIIHLGAPDNEYRYVAPGFHPPNVNKI